MIAGLVVPAVMCGATSTTALVGVKVYGVVYFSA